MSLRGSRFDKTAQKTKRSRFHLILLAKDNAGYKNLVTLVTRAYTEGFYYKPRIDMDILEQYSGGLIGLSACLKGEIPYYLQKGMLDRAGKRRLLINTYSALIIFIWRYRQTACLNK